MASIQKGHDVLTLINVFTVAPDRQAKLVDVLTQATHDVMKHMPGFISASIHRSMDGKKVVNYAQWASKEAFEAMQRHPEAGSHMKAAAALASYDPIVCEVSESIGADSPESASR
jgi:heme-degrading monooxygenase HmoA